MKDKEDLIYCQFCDEEMPYHMRSSATMRRSSGDTFDITSHGQVICADCGMTILSGGGSAWTDKLDREY